MNARDRWEREQDYIDDFEKYAEEHDDEWENGEEDYD